MLNIESAPVQLEALLALVHDEPNQAKPTLLNLIKDRKNSAIKTELQILLGICEAFLWKYDQAEKILRTALKKANTSHIFFAVGLAYDELASIYLIKSEIDLAMRTWLNGLQLALQQHDLKTQLRCNLGLGKVFFGMNDFRSAKRYHLTATELSYQASSFELICEVYVCLAVDFIRSYEFDKAFAALKIAEANLPAAQHPQRNRCEIKAYLGMVHSGLGQMSLALIEFKAACQSAKDHQYTWGLALSLIEQAKVLYTLKRYDDALELAHSASTAAQEMNSLAFSTQAHELMYQIYKDQQLYELALEQHFIFSTQHLEKMHRSKDLQLNSTTLRLLKQTHNFQVLEASHQENIRLVSRLEKHQELIQQLTSKAETDVLTGLYNRRALDARLEREVELALQLQQPFSLLMLDLDLFKQVNDLYSHQTGDRVLKEAAKLFIQSCRQGEFVARFGGEEFTVLLPGANLDDALKIAERIRVTIESFVWSSIEPRLQQQTISIGAACRHADESAGALMERADAQLYTAKNTGRNQVCG